MTWLFVHGVAFLFWIAIAYAIVRRMPHEQHQ